MEIHNERMPSLSHTRWDCKCDVVFIQKKHKKWIFGVLRQHLGEIFRELAKHKEAQIVEGHLMEIAFRYGSAYRQSMRCRGLHQSKSAISSKAFLRARAKFYWWSILGLVDISSQQLGSMKWWLDEAATREYSFDGSKSKYNLIPSRE